MKITNQWDEQIEVEVGDWVGFKCDIEQYGIIKSIQRGRNTVILTNENGFDGDYIGGDTETLVSLDEIWVD